MKKVYHNVALFAVVVFMANSSDLRAQQRVRGWRKKSAEKNHRFAVGSNFFLSRGFLTFFYFISAFSRDVHNSRFLVGKIIVVFLGPTCTLSELLLCLGNGKCSFSWKNVYFLDFKSPRGVFGIIPSCLYNFKTISSLPALSVAVRLRFHFKLVYAKEEVHPHFSFGWRV